jgi:hypothetical protein
MGQSGCPASKISCPIGSPIGLNRLALSCVFVFLGLRLQSFSMDLVSGSFQGMLAKLL